MLAFQSLQRHAMAEAINRHLTLVQRCKIGAYLSSSHLQRFIASELGVAPSTFSRQLQRNRIPEVGYDARIPHRTAVARRRATAQPRKMTPRHLDYIYERLVAVSALHKRAYSLTTAQMIEVPNISVNSIESIWILPIFIKQIRQLVGHRAA